MRYPSEDGFTLLELIIVMLIAGVAITLTTVALSRSYEKASLRHEAARAQRMLGYARERALMDRMPVRFAIDEAGGTYWLEQDGAVLGKVREAKKELLVDGEPVMFFPKGNSTGGSIRIVEREAEEKGLAERGYIVAVDPVTGSASVGRI